ncbi:MAG TPA: S41 family peptidase [Patescibacteria group bacterium]|nr:S41 family peptidase [Patescibacteria group bacterium]
METSLPPTSSEDVQATVSQYEHGYQIFKKTVFVFLVLCVLGGVFWSGMFYQTVQRSFDTTSTNILSPDDAVILNKKNQDITVDFALFWKVWGILKDKYVEKEKLDANALLYGAIDGMLAATDDPYTTFFDPIENKEFEEDISGVFEGIGAEMGIKNDILTIIAPLEGMPAEKAGLMAGDKIIKIDDQATINMSLEEAVSRIRGAKGSEVTLTIFRNGNEEAQAITVRRDVIAVKSVRFEMKDTVAYIRVNRFGDDTEKEFMTAVTQTLDMRAKGLVLDLRNNPGGLLDTSITMASVMLPLGKIVVIEENGDGKRKTVETRGGDKLSSLPTVMLINEGSASASEILAGALRENRDDVTLVGKKSFGKGSVQELIPTNKDTAVKITVARWLTPEGHQINTVGITPDVEVFLTREDLDNKRDPQLDKALEVLREKL